VEDPRLAPAGERFSLAGWLRALGFVGSDQIAPPRRWERQNVALVSDERELASFAPGARGRVGGTVPAGAAGTIATIQIVAGDNGLRIWMGVQANAFQWSVLSPQVIGAPLVVLPINWSDPQRIGTATASKGTVPAIPNVNGPQITAGASIWNPAPEIWVPPGQALLVWQTNPTTAIGSTAFEMIEHLSRPT
jgi:hypothetical protein